MLAQAPHDAFEALRQTLRKLAMGIIGVSVFTLLSGGLAVLTSILSIVMGAQLLALAATRQTLFSAVQAELLMGTVRGCCSCAGPAGSIRGLAIAIIVLAVLTMLIYIPAFSIIGSLSSSTQQYSCQTYGSNTCQISWYPPGNSLGYRVPCTTPYSGYSTCYLTLPSGYSNGISAWLFFVVGNIAIAAPLQVTLAAITLNVLKAMLGLSAEGSGAASASESSALLAPPQQPAFYPSSQQQPGVYYAPQQQGQGQGQVFAAGTPQYYNAPPQAQAQQQPLGGGAKLALP